MGQGFNGSTATFAGSALGSGLLGIRYREAGATPDCGSADDTDVIYEGGRLDKEIQIDFLGGSSVAKNDKGSVVITLANGVTRTITNAICKSIEFGGSVDDKTSGSAVFGPSTAP